ncbi:MAG: Mu-like prophage major head subunit gpT family protein [Candidatus Omnitrophota bacterium]
MDQSGLSSRAIIGKFFEILETSKDTAWPFRVGMEIPSNQESETYKWLGFAPALREWIGGRQAKGLRENGITIKNKKYEATLEIDVDDLRRDKTGQINIRIAELADRVNAHWGSLLSTLIANGGATVCYDGQYFFDNDHSEGDSGTLSNLLTVSDYGDLNVTTAADPTANEMAKVILKMIQHIYSLKDDQGEPMNENAKAFMIMVPVNMWAAGLQAASSNLLSTGTGAIDNPLKNGGFSLDVIANPRLSTTTVLYAFRTDGRAKPFILQNEEDIKVDAISEGSEEEIKNNRHLYCVKTLRNVGYGYWQQAIKATLS